MKILVTGANGYIGQGIVKELLVRGHTVVATDFNLDNVELGAQKKACDIFEIENPYDFFERPEILLHLAWRNGFIHNDDSHIKDFPLHYSFLEKMIKCGVKRVAVLGTMHEVGFFEGSINENTPTHPQSLYGIAKDALRNAIFLLCKQNRVVCQWIRGYYIVGNSQFGSSIFSKITQAEMRGESTFPFTLGQNQWDFIDYDQFCNQVSCVVEQDRVNGIINVCSGYPEKLADRVERFIKENGYKIKLEYGAFPDRPYDSKAVWGSDEKIKLIMGDK
ncbi:MAG: NAD(P)-dependent oxidoreductase [Roseburia sp.]|nr:NAD(P)-dependent oxidoreductase [Roseburia sp.]